MTELHTQLEELRAEILELAEIPELTDEQSARYEAANVEFDEIRSQIEAAEARAARIEEIRRFAPVGEVKPETTEASMPESINVNVRTSPFEGEGDLRSRALTAIESHLPKSVADEAREAMTAAVERESTRNYNADEAAALTLATCSPEYVAGFRSYLRAPLAGVPNELRAAMSLTAANGGVLVPQWLDSTIVLTNTGARNAVRQIARSEQITVDQADFVTSAGVTAEWLSEGTEAADATPTFVSPTITTHKAAAWVYGSYEVLADSGFDEIGMLIADGFDRLESTAFITGTGSGQPYGLVTVLSGTGPVVNGTSGAAGAADLVAADAYALDNALGPRWRSNAKFLAAKATYNALRKATDANDNFWASFGGGLPAEMIGYQVYEAEAMDTTVVSGSDDYVLLLGDFSNYVIADRIGTTLMFEPMVKGASQRPTGQAGWFAYKRLGANVLTSNAFKLLKV